MSRIRLQKTVTSILLVDCCILLAWMQQAAMLVRCTWRGCEWGLGDLANSEQESKALGPNILEKLNPTHNLMDNCVTSICS